MRSERNVREIEREREREREKGRREAPEASRRYEDYAYVLDFFPQTSPQLRRPLHRTSGTVHLLGELYFTLLEAALKENVKVAIGERIFIGKDPRDKIAYIIGRIRFKDLTGTAQAELPTIVEKVVKQRERWFTEFFNRAQALTPRMHSLELLPGIGKRYMRLILDEREKKPFTSFEDIKQRTGLYEPSKLIARRILEELSDEEPKYRLFTRGF
jgi:putative nucleotide binding protein